ncbi:MAG: hypothetical protein J6W84_04200, partial [Bacteroidales bacterium]|nr:hypothetical protein [Bacteroidales bacterium]
MVNKNIKKVIILLTLVIVGLSALAQTQPKFSYQAVLRDTNNRLVTNGNNITLKWEVMNISNNVIYTETHTGLVTNSQGLLSIYLGDSTLGIGSFGAIEWNNARVRTTMIYNGQTIVSPIEPIMAVPYALMAEKLSPNSTTIKEIYYVIDTVKAHVRQELADTSSSIRYQIDTIKTQLRVEIDTTSQQIRRDIWNTDSTLRAYVDTTARDIRQELTDSVSLLRADIHDTADVLRKAMKDSLGNYALQKSLDDTASALRSKIHGDSTVLAG